MAAAKKTAARIDTQTAEAVVPPPQPQGDPVEVVRRRIPGFKLVNGGWVRDPAATARKDTEHGGNPSTENR